MKLILKFSLASLSLLSVVNTFGMGPKPPSKSWQCSVGGSYYWEEIGPHCTPGLRHECPFPPVKHRVRRQYSSSYFSLLKDAENDATNECRKNDFPADCGKPVCKYFE